MGERSDNMGEAGVNAKVGKFGFPPPPLLLLLCVFSASCSGAGGEGRWFEPCASRRAL
jgi:hypothetical protein